MAKERMIRQLGEEQLLLPELVQQALVANDRVKYLLALLQAAQAAADGAAVSDLHEERIAAGVQDPALDRTVAASVRTAGGLYCIPGVEQLVARALDAVEMMLVPLAAADSAAKELDGRLAALRGGLDLKEETISRDALATLTAADRSRDSLHLLVIDAHRQLNLVAAGIATEAIDGARTHDLAPGDRELVGAFMRGVNATERLRFEHPGLVHIATRVGDAVVIQNELGLTDAHVVVVRVTRAGGHDHLHRRSSGAAALLPAPAAPSCGVDVGGHALAERPRRSKSGLFHLATGSFGRATSCARAVPRHSARGSCS